MPEGADVVVIGGGCTGTSIAWQLAQRGAGRVVLLEKDGIAAGATGRSSAIVRTHYTHPVLARIALRALRIFERFGEVVGGEAGFRRTGFLALVGPADAEAVRANVAMHREIGISAQALAPDELGAIDPRLVSQGVGAAAWEPESGYADPVLVTNSYSAAARQEGVQQRVGTHALRLRVGRAGLEAVDTSQGPIATRLAVVAAGFRSVDLLAPLGFVPPLRAVRHTIGLVERTPDFGPLHPTISDRVNGAYFRPEGASITLIGTTAPYDGREDPQVEADRSPEPADLAVLVSRFCRRYPSQERAGLRGGYTGVYDCSPDLQPLLGPVPGLEGIYLACGFSGHGFKLSPVVGELMAERILEGRSRLVDLDLFSPGRFQAERPIVADHAYSVATLG